MIFLLFLLVVKSNKIPNNIELEIEKELEKNEKFLESIKVYFGADTYISDNLIFDFEY